MQERNAPKIRHLYWCNDQALTGALAQMDLTASQGHVLGYLNHCEAPPVARDLENALKISHACAAGILERLAKKGFIEFRPDPRDRRCKRIYVLEKASRCHSHIHETMAAVEAKMMAGFTPQEQEQFSALLSRAVENMGGIPRCRKKEEQT